MIPLTVTFSLGDLDLTAEVAYSPGTPSQTSGPPEWCYEGDPEEVEILSLTVEAASDEALDILALLVALDAGEALENSPEFRSALADAWAGLCDTAEADRAEADARSRLGDSDVF